MFQVSKIGRLYNVNMYIGIHMQQWLPKQKRLPQIFGVKGLWAIPTPHTILTVVAKSEIVLFNSSIAIHEYMLAFQVLELELRCKGYEVEVPRQNTITNLKTYIWVVCG